MIAQPLLIQSPVHITNSSQTVFTNNHRQVFLETGLQTIYDPQNPCTVKLGYNEIGYDELGYKKLGCSYKRALLYLILHRKF